VWFTTLLTEQQGGRAYLETGDRQTVLDVAEAACVKLRRRLPGAVGLHSSEAGDAATCAMVSRTWVVPTAGSNRINAVEVTTSALSSPANATANAGLPKREGLLGIRGGEIDQA